MRKYFKIFKTSMKNTYIYPIDAISMNFIMIAVVIIKLFLWKAIYINQGATIGGYSIIETMWYVIIADIVGFAALRNIARTLSEDVKDGSIAYKLVKPYNYIFYLISITLGKKIITLLLTIITGVLMAALLVGALKSFTLISIAVGVFTIIMGIILQLIICLCIGMIAFWFEEVSAFLTIYMRTEFVIGGGFMPLIMFPEKIYNLIKYLPFSYITFKPLDLFIKFDINKAINIFKIQAIYIMIFSIIGFFIYRKGVGKLNVYGG